MSDNVQAKTIELPASMTVRDLAQTINLSPIEVIKTLMTNGVMANINQQIDFDTAAIVASEMGFEAVLISDDLSRKEDLGEIPFWRRMIAKEDQKNLIDRAPVITILGHVDHGKTTLLDAIRQTNVAGGEAGGITQHIGAYQVEHKNRLITFLDTPGHAAFTQMRARGAQGADIVVLVVAADDGVMPQTKEAVAHAKAAKVPIIVAMNKIDKPNADPNRLKQQLAEIELVPDDWDGDTIVVPISAKQKTGLDDLLEAILLVADNMEIQANPKGKVLGTVIEAEIDKSKGVVATLLVQNGTLETGDTVVAGTAYGKLRAMFDYRGRKVRKAEPSTPVSVMGLNEVPSAGEIFEVLNTEKEARQVLSVRQQTASTKVSEAKVFTLEQLFERIQSGELRELRLIIKVDVQGSVDPIVSSIKDLGTEDVSINILHVETGNIGNNDIMLAAASKAVVVGFNVTADDSAKRLAESEGVSIRTYNIIYRMIEDIEKALKGMLEPEMQQVVIGKAQVLAVFKISKIGQVAGSKVVDGEMRRNAKVRVMRAGKIIHEGEFGSLKHLQEDVREVRSGFEFGASIKNFNDFHAGDILECYIMETKPVA